ncbi:MucR family transcriptional regulator [Loktanella salsilacus]|uniref:MucR family transcriptional regulator n=1 Tax=Loktanella salsilacus TaxID=195913 RepID=UPI0037358AA8
MSNINDKALEIVKAFASRENATADEVMNLFKGLVDNNGSNTQTPAVATTAVAPAAVAPGETTAPNAEATPAPEKPKAPAKLAPTKASTRSKPEETTTERLDLSPAEEPTMETAPSREAPAEPEAKASTSNAPMKPFIPVEKSVTNEKIHCLCCGQGMRMLKRHLRTAHDMTPDQYRIEFNLPNDYPMSAPGFSAAKAEMAKRLEFGKYDRQEEKS